MAKTDYAEAQIIGHRFGNVTAAQPTQWWVALYDQDPTDAVVSGTPAQLGTRTQITWNIVGSRAVQAADIQFDPVPPGEVWNVTHIAIFDAETGGNALEYGPVSQPSTLKAGDIVIFPAGLITVEER